MAKRLIPGMIKIRNDQVFTQFSKSYEDTLDQNNVTPDVILKIGKEKYEYYCHRIMLASASNFLRMVLRTATPGTIPVIILPDVNYTVVDYVLMYIYYGEVQVPEVKYADFVEACKLMDLKAPIDEVIQFVDDDEDEEEEEEDDEFIDSSEYGDIEAGEIQDVEFLDGTESQNSQETDTKPKIQNPPLPQPKHYRVSLTENSRIGQYQPQQRMRMSKGGSKFETKRIDATPSVRKRAQECLVLSVQRAYNSLGIVISAMIQTKIKESRLVIENNQLVRGITCCGICNFQINVAYRVSRNTGFIVYSNHSLKQHLTRKHVKYLNSV
ncbi:uncharacterized protein LOC134830792 [Culicoides brevitarsis]|uniref:uncharacterized protein LOC134830792 n=1 Tax=Culicoides brevitarsis TaxID=469753 RepID=UPI00307C4BED